MLYTTLYAKFENIDELSFNLEKYTLPNLSQKKETLANNF